GGEGGHAVHPRAQGQAHGHVVPRSDGGRVVRGPHVQDGEGHESRGDQRRDEERERRVDEGRAGVHRRGSRLERLRGRPAQLDLRLEGGHRAEQAVLQGGELVRQRGRVRRPVRGPDQVHRGQGRGEVTLNPVWIVIVLFIPR